jgi:hypothetical protein
VRTAFVEFVHVTIACGRPSEAVRDAILKDVPPLDPALTRTGAHAAEIEADAPQRLNSGCSRLATMGCSLPPS